MKFEQQNKTSQTRKKKKCRSTKLTELTIKIQTQITILKLIKLEQKEKEKKGPSEPWWGGHAVVGGEKRDPSDLFVCERKRESFLNALE